MEAVSIILIAAFSAAVLFLITKLLGHKQISQLDFFDYVTGITIGSIAAELATELETPERPLLAMAVYGVIAFLLSILSGKFMRLRKYINGSPTILMDNGKLYRENMKKSKLDLSEFLCLCRQAGYFDLSAIQTAVFEYNGKLSILPVASRRPTTPEDMGLGEKIEKEKIQIELIMDGRILDGNLKRRGLDSGWLKKQLKALGYSTEKQVFLAVCDTSNSLTAYGFETTAK